MPTGLHAAILYRYFRALAYIRANAPPVAMAPGEAEDMARRAAAVYG